MGVDIRVYSGLALGGRLVTPHYSPQLWKLLSPASTSTDIRLQCTQTMQPNVMIKLTMSVLSVPCM